MKTTNKKLAVIALVDHCPHYLNGVCFYGETRGQLCISDPMAEVPSFCQLPSLNVFVGGSDRLQTENELLINALCDCSDFADYGCHGANCHVTTVLNPLKTCLNEAKKLNKKAIDNPFCENCIEEFCEVSTDDTCKMVRVYLNKKKEGV